MKDTDFSFDYTNIRPAAVGSAGLSDADISAGMPTVQRAFTAARKALPGWGFTALPQATDRAQEIRKLADKIAGRCEDFVVLGIGGSALGNSTLQSALNPPFYNLMSREKRGDRPRIHIPDNIDPVLIGNLLDTLNPATTVINVIAKSGKTSETLANFLIFKEFLENEHGPGWKDQVIITTDPANGPLRALASELGIKTLEVPPDVGGRFSVLSPVGLLSAAVAGIPITDLLSGADEMLARCSRSSWDKNPAFYSAVIHYLYDKQKNIRLNVLMPYAQQLRDVADWFRQIWAESLGKRIDRNGNEVYCGLTPIKALGATDQHSQMQLYIEGPLDKLITFIHVEAFSRNIEIPEAFSDEPSFSYLNGKTLTDLLHAEEYATRAALTKAGRPTLTVSLSALNARTLGQLLMFFELQTAYAGELYGINAFDQPGVEQGKIFTGALMGRKGYEEARAELEQMTLSDPGCCI